MNNKHIAINLEDRGVVTLKGEEVTDFLQDLVTADVMGASASEAVYGLLLTPQGKFLFDFFILHDDDTWILECERGRAEDLRKRLTMYRLRKKIEIENASEAFHVIAVVGGDVPDDAEYVYADPRHKDLGQRAIMATPIDETLGDLAEYERLRIELGIPSAGHDLLPEVSFPLDCNMDELQAIDFDKGCYVGQEVTSRSKHRGNVRKRILPVQLSRTGVLPGSEIIAGDKNGGEILSVEGDIALAMIRLERWTTAGKLLSGDVEVTPRIPDWLQLEAG